MNSIIEPSKSIRVIEEADLCVLGGSCTGVFAAVRAARLGARVVLVEKQNCFGGVATSGLVNVWHSFFDTAHEKQIIAGLSQEVVERLKKRDAVGVREKDYSAMFNLNTEELKIELDRLVLESKVKPYLHTFYCAPFVEDNVLQAIFIENKSGRGAIKAKVFIDATGDGDLCAQLDLPSFSHDTRQPPTTCAKLYGLRGYQDFSLQRTIWEHREEFGLKEDWGWSTFIPNMPELTMNAETHVFDTDCTDGDSLTLTEMEGRRQVRAILDILKKYGPPDNRVALAALPSCIGIRETRHIQCQYRLTEEDVLYGRRFEDAIANGSYRVDVHLADKPGIIFRYLDGTEVYYRTGYPKEMGRWREEAAEYPTFYQIPYRSMLPGKFDNLIACGRMIDADKGAYGAIRVMVNMNQTGEAAGAAAYLALDQGTGVAGVAPALLRKTLEAGGSIII